MLRPSLFSFSLSLLLCAGCGKYGKPYAPEKLSPRAIQFGEIRGTTQGVVFQWLAPQTDVRGKRLKSLRGYHVYRKKIGRPSDVIDPDVPFELIDTIEDSTMALLERKQSAARADLRPAQRLGLADEERRVSFIDTQVVQGETYLYKIVAFNRSSVDGDARQFVKVTFLGDASQVSPVDNTKLDPSLIEDAREGPEENEDTFS